METAEVTNSVAGAFVYSCVAAQHYDGELLTSRLGPKVEISVSPA